LSRLITYAKGKEILVLGPASAGKTHFGEYLRLGTLGREGERKMTFHVSKSPVFTIRVGKDGGRLLNVRRAVDTPGQVGPVQHANLVGRRKPDGVILVLDCSQMVSTTVRWVDLFCDRLDTVLRRGSVARRKLHEMLVLLNKRDRIDESECERLRGGVAELLDRHLSVVLGRERARSIPIFECISVETEQGTVLIEAVVARLAERLGK
jgi:hypothetical protein